MPVAQAYARFASRCPVGCQVTIRGPTLVDYDGEPCFDLLDGQLLVVAFVPWQDADEEDESDQDPPSDAETDASDSSGHSMDSADASTSRSRSPPSTELAFGHSAVGHHQTGPRPQQEGMCSHGCKEQAHPLGSHGCTSVTLAVMIACLVGFIIAFPALQATETSRTASCVAAILAGARSGWWPIFGICALLCLVEPVVGHPGNEHPLIASTSGHCHLTAVVGTLAALLRPVPTPCRSSKLTNALTNPSDPAILPADWDLSQTLLRQSIQRKDSLALLDAVAILEVLFEHFSDRDALKDSPAAASKPVMLCLEDSIELTDFQQQALSLSHLMSFLNDPCNGKGSDWLDNDLTVVVRNPAIPLELRTRFVNIPMWHAAGQPQPESITIFTDGSASQVETDKAPCGWAFGVWAHVFDQSMLIGCAAGAGTLPGSPFHLGEHDDLPQTAEQLALAWAFCWIVEYAPSYRCSVTVAYDCLVAGKGAFGDWKLPTQPYGGGVTPLTIGLVHLRQLAAIRVELKHRHVAGHAGHLENELADQLAKAARRCRDDPSCSLLPHWPANFLSHSLSAWGWMLTDQRLDLPTLFAMESEARRLQAMDARSAAAPFPDTAQKSSSIECHLTMVAVTFNALTLRDSKTPEGEQQVGLKLIGRKRLLKEQLAPFRPLFVGLQETRLPCDGTQADDEYYIFQSGATHAGHNGCSLWIARSIPYAKRGATALYIRSTDINICASSPRHICACISSEALRIMVMVIHSPNTAHTPLAEYEDFWQQRATEIERRPNGYEYLLLADANARVGSVETDAIGGYGQETENPPGEVFHDFLHRINACLPTTFAHVHEGPTSTWVSPFGDRHRLDYPVIPSSWMQCVLSSHNLEDLELLQVKEDHIPVLLRMECDKRAPPPAYCPVRRKACRPAKPQDEAAQAHVQASLATIPAIQWGEDVDQHYQTLSTSWCAVAERLATPECARANNEASPISDQACWLIHQRKSLRAYLRREAQERNRRLKQFGFAAFLLAFRGLSFGPGQLAVLRRWFVEMDTSEAEAMHWFHLYGYHLRKQVAQDRRLYLKSLADNIKLQDIRHPRALFQAVKKAFPATRASNKSAFRPLPAVCDEQGELAVTVEDRMDRWRAHFGAQEAGFVVTESEYVEHMQNMPKLTDQPVFDIGVIPTLAELEGIAQGLNVRKAVGLDNVSSELLQLHTPTTMRQFFPLCLKASLSIREPVHFRGGELFCLAKKAGAVLQCSSFRSILISSVPGKVMHRALRTRLVGLLQDHRPPLQAGAVPGEGIECISLAAQSFQQLRDGMRKPWALVFYDIQSAFYSVVREFVVPGPADDRGILKLLHALNVPAAAIPELRAKLEGIALLPTLKASPHLTALVQDLYRGSWFKLTNSSVITLTQKGTRPGDPVADAVFGLTMTAMLCAITESLQQQGLLPEVPTCSHPPSWAATKMTSWGCPAWADDFVQPIAADGEGTLMNNIRAGVVTVAGRVSALGMRLTFAVEKTAALIPSWLLTGPDQVCLDDQSQRHISVRDAVTGDFHNLPVVSAYKHLGGIVTADASPVADLHHRHSRAQTLIRPLRARLFARQDIPVQTRRILLRSLAVAKFAHTGAAFFLRAAFHKRLWAQQYVRLWRALFPHKAPDQHLHSYTVLRRAQAPSPPLALARARAGFLARLARVGPPELAYLLCAHYQQAPRTAWLSQLEDDFAIVATFVPEVKGMIRASSPVLSLLEALEEDPKWWYRQTVRACRVFLEDLDTWAGQGSPTPPPPVIDMPRPYDCHLCGAKFRLRKHLGVHLARTHQVISPTRHFAPVPYCLSCHRHYGSIPRVQMHLKQKHSCLVRCMQVIPPMCWEDIVRVESAAKAAAAKVKKGSWKTYTPPCAAMSVFGPVIPTWHERCPDVDSPEDSTFVAQLRRSYIPSSATTDWILGYIAEKSSEGPRHSSASFWCSRPSQTRFTMQAFLGSAG